MIAFYENLLARAKRGDVQGAITVLSIANENDEIAICGEFAENLIYASVAARVGFDRLIGHKVCQEQETTAKRRVRKERQG